MALCEITIMQRDTKNRLIYAIIAIAFHYKLHANALPAVGVND